MHYVLPLVSRCFTLGRWSGTKNMMCFFWEKCLQEIFLEQRKEVRELAWEAIVDSLNEINSPKFQLKDKKAQCTRAVEPSPKKGLQTDERRREGKWDFCRVINGKIDYWKYSSRSWVGDSRSKNSDVWLQYKQVMAFHKCFSACNGTLSAGICKTSAREEGLPF